MGRRKKEAQPAEEAEIEVVIGTAPVQMPMPEPVRPEDIKQFTTRDVAEELGIHRVTLLRMEQNGRIEKAQWTRLPQPHRVYSRNDIKKIRDVLARVGDVEGRVYVDRGAA